MRNLLERILEEFLKAVFPTRCLICGRFFEKPDRPARDGAFQEVMAAFLCPACSFEISVVESPKCSICGFMFPSRQGEDHPCAKCVKTPPPYGKARAYGLYDRSLRQAIHLLKYRGKTYLARPLGRLLFRVFTENWKPDQIDIVIPVPLHGGRLRKRGFNQTYQLVRKWPEYLHRMEPDKFCSPAVSQEVLFRKRATKAQVGMIRKERLQNIRGVFSLEDPLLIDDKRVLIVDDVFTTGATAIECAKTLIKHGAARVDVLTLAQTDRHLR